MQRLSNGILVNDSTAVFVKLVGGQVLTDDELIYTNGLSRESIIDLARGQTPNIESLLYEVCDNEHASCNSNCPVWDLQTQEEKNADGCPCFKNGKAMKNFIQKRSA